MDKCRDRTINAVLPMLSFEAKGCFKESRGEFRIRRPPRRSRIIARHNRMNARISAGELGLRGHNVAHELEPSRRSRPCQVVSAPERLGRPPRGYTQNCFSKVSRRRRAASLVGNEAQVVALGSKL